jgi:mRNA interferase MazF
MAISYHPKVGQVLICDFEGLKYYEMSKRRFVVVLSPKYAQSQNVCTVIPLSTTPPPRVRDFHYILDKDPYPKSAPDTRVWAKCDHVFTVSFERLSGWWDERDAEGKRKYEKLFVTDNDLTRIRKCVLYALGLGELTKHM